MNTCVFPKGSLFTVSLPPNTALKKVLEVEQMKEQMFGWLMYLTHSRKIRVLAQGRRVLQLVHETNGYL